jgi:hypothetical protein
MASWIWLLRRRNTASLIGAMVKSYPRTKLSPEDPDGLFLVSCAKHRTRAIFGRTGESSAGLCGFLAGKRFDWKAVSVGGSR